MCTLLTLLTTCQFDKLISPPSSIAMLAVAPMHVLDTAALGSIAVHSDTLALANAGEGTLSWRAKVMGNAPWLVLSTGGGTAPSKVSVSLDPRGLALGVYHDTVLVSAENAGGSPALVPVELVVRPCIVRPVDLDVQVTDSLTPSTCAAPHRATSFARLYSFTAQAGDSVSVVMLSTALGGYVLIDSATAAGVPPLVQSDACGSQPGACLPYALLPEAGTYIVEATSRGAGETGSYTLNITRPRAPDGTQALGQLRSDSTIVVPVGGGIDQPAVVLRGVVSDPNLADALRLEVEVRPLATAFTGVPTATSAPVANGGTALVAVAGLVNSTAYHWQARAADPTGRAGAWTAFGGNAETAADFNTTIPEPPDAPTGLGQLQIDGSTTIPVGGAATSRSVIFQGTVADPNPSDQLRLEVEIQPVGTSFTGAASGSSPAVANGAVATATVAGLNDNTAYHWRAHTVDQTGRASPWASFGGNAETATDFRSVAGGATQMSVAGGDAQTDTVGQALPIPLAVRVADQFNNPVQGVTISWSVLDGGGSVNPATSTSNASGIASTTWTLGPATSPTDSVQTVQATGVGSPLYLNAFTVPGPVSASQTTLVASPGSITASSGGAPSTITVTVRDQFGNVIRGQPVVLAATGTGNTLTQPLGPTNASGVATGTLSSTVAASKTVSATINAVAITQTATVVVNAGAVSAAQSTVTATSPITASSGSSQSTITVTARDGLGNPVAGATVVLAATGTGNTLTQPVGVTNASGVATGTLSATVAESKTVSATTNAVGITQTATVVVSAGAASQLTFTTQPQSALALAVLSPAVVVAVRDALGNVVTTFTGAVTIAIGNDASLAQNATLGGTTAVAAVSGVASFGDLTLDQVGNGYTLVATATSISGVTSNPFNITVLP